MPTIIRSDAKAREKPCLRCGLSLRKVLDAKHCPRCGLSVWLSLNQNDSLDWSHPGWLGRIAVGAGVMAASFVLAYVAYALIMVPVFAAEWRYVWAALAGGAFLVIYHLGMLILAAYEGRHPDKTAGYRLAMRIVAAVGIVAGLVFLGLGVARLGTGWPVYRIELEARRPVMAPMAAPTTAPDEYDEAMDEEYTQGAVGGRGMRLLLEALMIASGLATWAYVRKLAWRIPNSTVARICGYLMFLPLLSLFKVLPFFTFGLAALLHWLIIYLPIFYIPFAAGLLAYCAIAYRRAARTARQSWAAETAAVPPAAPPAV